MNVTRPISIKTYDQWYNQSFAFQTFYTDLLEFEVKDKFVKTWPTMNRFLGKLTTHVGFLIDKLNKKQETIPVNDNNVSSITDGEERINHVSSEENNTSNQVDTPTSLISNDQSLDSSTKSLVDESLSTVSDHTIIGHDEEQEEINEDNIDDN
ncbi:unnamed protein product [Rotaria socialis]|uniref:Uncharacterized protein n=2 Tax=Rotaria socialis TaxID=392032 RepID=A0A821TG10_9BILA|nr:unnamed protein product [Rotaria socialis]CAF4566729.1 unnamed protein product [Rotaria socialis]CAF4875870.1 unnamed protein product [Rotaria socialis]